MGGKNKYAATLHEMFRLGVETGIRMGTQFDWDCMQLALRSKEAVGKDTFGKNRIGKLFNVHRKIRKKYVTALTNEADSDALRYALDQALREIHGDELIPFEKRYDEIKPIDISKPKKSWIK